MELLKLKIKNIASISDAEIDFSAMPLANEPIFLICGETGAGKSTILDAICLALYNEAPRLAVSSSEALVDDSIPAEARSEKDTVKINDTKQFLRKGTGNGFVELTFTGNDGKQYEAVWSLSRAYGKPSGRLKNVEWSVKCGNDVWGKKKEVEAKIEEATGMNFEQYCKTAMLAQGEFSKFLKSSEDEKAVILEKLTKTDIYSKIGAMIARKYKEHKNAFEIQHLKTEGIVLMNAEEKTECRNEIVSMEHESSIYKMKKEIADKKLKWLDDAQKKQTMIEEARAWYQKAEAEASSEDFRTKADICRDWDATAGQRALLERMERQNEALQKCKTAQRRCRNDYSSMNADMDRKKQEIQKMSDEAGNLRQKLEHERENEGMFMAVETICAILNGVTKERGVNSETRKVLEQKKVNIQAAEEAIATEIGKKAKLEAEKTAWQEAYKNLTEKIRLSGKENLTAEKDKLAERKVTVTKAEAAVRNLETEERRLKEYTNEAARMNAALIEARRRVAENRILFDAADKKFHEEKELYLKMKESTYDWAVETREKLKKGDICPVCGQKVETILTKDKFNSLLKPVEERYKSAEEARTAADSALNLAMAEEKSASEVLHSTTEKAVKAEENAKACRTAAMKECAPLKINSDQEHIMSALQRIYDETESKLSALSARLETVAELEKKAAETHLKLEQADTALGKSRTAAENLKQQTDSLKSEAVRLESDITARLKSIEASMGQAGKLIARNGWIEEFDRDPDAFLEALTKESKAYMNIMQELTGLEKEIEKKNSILANAEMLREEVKGFFPESGSPADIQESNIGWDSMVNKWNAFLADIRTIEQQITETGADIMSCSGELEKFYSEGKIGPDRLRMLYRYSAAHIEAEKANIASVLERLTASRSAVEQRKKDLEIHMSAAPALNEEDSMERLQAESKRLDEAIAKLNQQIGAMYQKLQIDEENCKKFENEKNKEMELKAIAEKWEKMNILLGDNEGKKFKRIAQSFILSDLIRNANTYLERLSRRYVLDHQNGSLTITVRDIYQGGAERSVNTLSGGETFLVSLALALGLSSLSSNTMKVSTLFIDEGFGTLSAECLNTVMEALENLHQIGGKKVGIISHVEVLRERIPVKIQLTRQGNSSSRVSIVTA